MNSTELSQMSGAFSQQSLAGMSGGMQRQTTKEIERVQGQAMVSAAHEQARGLLSNIALQESGALSALEAHLVQVAPLGEARYKLIADAHAMGAAQKIARW